MTAGPLGGALRLTLAAPAMWAVGLAGFLARGGIVLFALPIVVLPSVVGLTTFVGPNAVTAAGLAPRFVAIVALGTVLLLAWIIGATLVAAATDGVLIRWVVATAPTAPVRDVRLTALFVVRLVSLVPFALGVAIGGVRLGQVGYQELILPSNGSTHFVIRVLEGAPEVVVLLAITWLLTELLGAVGVRLAVDDGRPAGRALAGSPVWIVGHPVRSVSVIVGTVVGSVIVIVPAIALAAAAWGAVRIFLLGDAGLLLGGVAIVTFAAVWAAGLALAGAAATWRSAAWSLAVMGDHRGGGPAGPVGGTL